MVTLSQMELDMLKLDSKSAIDLTEMAVAQGSDLELILHASFH